MTMVLGRLVSGVMVVLAGALGVQSARADVYIWTDASGRMNVGNLAPPEGARVTRVIPSPPKSEAREEAAREAARRAEIQALNDRVARLQDQLEQTRHDVAVAAAYAVPPPVVYPPPVPQYAAWAPPPVQYVAEAPQQPAMGCDAWNNCGGWWGASSWPYLTSVVVLRDNNFHRFGPGRNVRPVGPRPPPARAPWDPRRR